MLYFFLTYLFISLVLYVMSEQSYIFPWFGDKVLAVSGPSSSFLWPIGFVISITGGLGLFKTKVVDKDDTDKD